MQARPHHAVRRLIDLVVNILKHAVNALSRCDVAKENSCKVRVRTWVPLRSRVRTGACHTMHSSSSSQHAAQPRQHVPGLVANPTNHEHSSASATTRLCSIVVRLGSPTRRPHAHSVTQTTATTRLTTSYPYAVSGNSPILRQTPHHAIHGPPPSPQMSLAARAD